MIIPQGLDKYNGENCGDNDAIKVVHSIDGLVQVTRQLFK